MPRTNNQPKELVECKRNLLPVKDSLDILGGKWRIMILATLLGGKKRFKEMQRDIGGITAKMLSKELKEFELNEMVRRTVYDTTPVTVEYEITEYGKTIKNVIEELQRWGVQHRKRILRKDKNRRQI